MGVGMRTIRDWVAAGAPRKTVRGYDVAAVREWRQKNLKPAPGHGPPQNGTDPLLVGSDSPALERYRLARAKHEELDLAERERQLVSREDLHSWLVQLSNTLRAAGDRLQRMHGVDALRIVEEALDEFDRQVKEKLGSANGTTNGSGG